MKLTHVHSRHDVFMKHLSKVSISIKCFWHFHIKSQLKRHANELAGDESSDADAVAGRDGAVPSTSFGAASKIKRQEPLEKSVDTIPGDVVAEKAKDVAVHDRIEALLDGVDVATH